MAAYPVSACRKQYREIFDDLKATFESDKTKSVPWRKEVLRSFVRMIKENHEAMAEAVKQDLGGGLARGTLEMGMIDEAENAIKMVDSWAADVPVRLGDLLQEVPILDQRVIRPTPKGVVLIIGAWNFNLSLCLQPLIDVIAAGNVAVIKPSEMSPACAQIVETLIKAYLPNDAVRVIQGGVDETTELLKLPWDHILYTGSTAVGKIVMEAAAKHLTPVTLELGGKNPTFIDRTAKLSLAADRTLLVKTCNAGQWCVDADYVLVEEAVAEEFASLIVSKAQKMLGAPATQRGEGIDPKLVWFNRIISERHVLRLKSYLDEDHGGRVLMGGAEHIDVAAKFVPFTIVLNPSSESKLMTEEMFGPILVIYTVPSVDAGITLMKKICATPLALYIYSEDQATIDKVLTKCASGSVGVNTTCEQSVGPCSPFGGVGQSGMGAYHGKFGFDEFSHRRTVLYRTTKIPIAFLPTQLFPVDNRFPGIVYPFLVKAMVTGLVPGWMRTAAKVGAGAALALGFAYTWRYLESTGWKPFEA